MSLALMVDEPIPGHFYWMLLRQEKPGESPTAFAHARGPLRTHRSAVEEGLQRCGVTTMRRQQLNNHAPQPAVPRTTERMAPFEPHLTELDDQRLAEAAQEWRARAMRGEKAAYGPAQALESEVRRRKRDRGPRQLAPAQGWPPVRPWWRFW